jgi:probable sporulation protein (polysaccharide deacetylase family)
MGMGMLKGKGSRSRIIALTISVSVLAILTAGVFLYSGKSLPVFGGPIYKGSERSKGVAITVNVDWGSEYLPDMLSIFEATGIKATFFITGRWAKNNIELAKLIFDSGHEIGNHGYSHKDHSKLDYAQNRSEIERTQVILERIIGKAPKFFAPPSGAYNRDTLKASEDLGCEVILWSIDTIDWKRDGADNILSRVKKKLHGGGIILMHPTDQTLEALPSIIKEIGDRKFEIISLEEIVKTIEN